MARGFLVAVTAACVAFAPCALVDSAQASKKLNSSRSNIYRMGGGGGHSNSAKVKGTKSNTSERMGGGGGGMRGGGSSSPAGVINLDSRPGSNY